MPARADPASCSAEFGRLGSVLGDFSSRRSKNSIGRRVGAPQTNLIFGPIFAGLSPSNLSNFGSVTVKKCFWLKPAVRGQVGATDHENSRLFARFCFFGVVGHQISQNYAARSHTTYRSEVKKIRNRGDGSKAALLAAQTAANRYFRAKLP